MVDEEERGVMEGEIEGEWEERVGRWEENWQIEIIYNNYVYIAREQIHVRTYRQTYISHIQYKLAILLLPHRRVNTDLDTIGIRGLHSHTHQQ